MQKLEVTFDTQEYEVAIDRHVKCDICRDTKEFEPLDLEGFPSGAYQPCPVCMDGGHIDHDPNADY